MKENEKKVVLTTELSKMLKDDIMNNVYREGDKLPSESKLCVKYGVSRSTVRGALYDLRALGLVVSQFGRGTFVNNISVGNMMLGLVPTAILTNDASVVELVEFRRCLEGEICYNACLKSTDADIEKIEILYEKMRENANDTKEFAKYDLAFHLAIANMTNNSLIIKVYEIIYEVFMSSVEKILSNRGTIVGIYYHGEILKAFRNKDAKLAKKCMNKHMDNLLNEEIEAI